MLQTNVRHCLDSFSLGNGFPSKVTAVEVTPVCHENECRRSEMEYGEKLLRSFTGGSKIFVMKKDNSDNLNLVLETGRLCCGLFSWVH